MMSRVEPSSFFTRACHCVEHSQALCTAATNQSQDLLAVTSDSNTL